MPPLLMLKTILDAAVAHRLFGLLVSLANCDGIVFSDVEVVVRLKSICCMFALLVSACASVPLEKQAVQIEDDKFSKNAVMVGTKLFENPFGGTSKEWFIRSFVNKETGSVRHQLYVATNYPGDWRFYNSAADDTATALPFLSIDRQVNDCHAYCDFDETFAVVLQDSTLRARAGGGFEVKISAKDGSAFILQVPPGQIQPQLATVDEYRRIHQLPMQATYAPAIGRITSASAPTLGIQGLPTPAPFTGASHAPNGGFLVLAVSDDSAASRAGLSKGDIILSANGKPWNTKDDMAACMNALHHGDRLALRVWHLNHEQTMQVNV
jgi:hypothetical protein